MGDEESAGFGQLLWRLRRAAGLTQEDLAARAGLSARGISDLERGVRQAPRRDTLTLLADALGLAAEDRAALIATARRPVTAAKRPDQALAPGAQRASNRGAQAADGHTPGAASTPTPHNLPAQPTLLLGRDGAVRAIVGLLRRADVRLVTLTGPGGVGKTRLAIDVGAELLDDFTDGVWFVRLSRLTDAALVVSTIAQTLGVKEAGDESLGQLLRRHLHERHMALVLDNCEHVVAGMAGVAELLETSPALKVLATSRAPLRLRGEYEYPVPPLVLPPTVPALGAAFTPEHLTAYPAVALFVERARALRPDFALTTASAPVVVDICARLDGLPLAIELAAARLKMLDPAALLARLEHGLGLLVGGTRDVAEWQQAIHSTVAWSEHQLAAAERALFRRLAVFAGGCTLEAAEAVCGAPEGAEPLGMDALDGLSALVGQSLVQRRTEGTKWTDGVDEGESRFGMLHVIREYALERLEASGERDALRHAHARFVLGLVERAEPHLSGPEAGRWLDQLERELDNLRAALGWAEERGQTELGLHLGAAALRFWMARGHLREGREWLERMLSLEPQGQGAVRARALRAAGVLALYQGDWGTAQSWLTEAAALGRAAGDLLTAANALTSLGITMMHQGDLERARTHNEASLALMRTVGGRRGIATTLVNLGVATYQLGDLARAESCFLEALALGREVGDRDLIATADANLASVALRRGDVAQGEALGRAALALYRDLGDPRRCAIGLEGLASSGGMAGLGERAARLLGAAATLRAALGAPLPANERADIEQAVAAARAALGEEGWAAAFAGGQALALDHAIAEALGEE